MSKLRVFNEQLVEQYKLLPHKSLFSYPLLVSSNNIYLDNINKANPKIFYIGQETNCWINNVSLEEVNCDLLENAYFNFFYNRHCTNRDFWKFICKILDCQREDLGKQVIWSNAYIVGKKNGLGTPPYKEELEKISVDNLLFLSEFFKPDLTLFVTGPTWNYYNIMIEYLKNKKSVLLDKYPTKTNPIVEDSENAIVWTYHPANLHRLGIEEEIENYLQKQYIKKSNFILK